MVEVIEMTVQDDRPVRQVLADWQKAISPKTPKQIKRGRWAANRARKYFRKFLAAGRRRDAFAITDYARRHMCYAEKGCIKPSIWLSLTEIESTELLNVTSTRSSYKVEY